MVNAGKCLLKSTLSLRRHMQSQYVPQFGHGTSTLHQRTKISSMVMLETYVTSRRWMKFKCRNSTRKELTTRWNSNLDIHDPSDILETSHIVFESLLDTLTTDPTPKDLVCTPHSVITYYCSELNYSIQYILCHGSSDRWAAFF